MNQTSIYLSGPIDEADEVGARNWRERVHDFFAGYKCVRILDPLRGKDDSIDKSDYTPSELVLRDTADIERANVLLVYYNARAGYLSWGTPGEAALAAYLRRPVVLVTDNVAVYMHPWARYQSVRTFGVAHLHEACAYIYKMWVKGVNGAGPFPITVK